LEHNLYKFFAISWTLIILYLCLDDAPNVPNFNFPNKDKLVHFIFYFVFVFIWSKSIIHKDLKKVLLILGFAIFLGCTIEVLQENFTLHRSFDWYDILANTIGAMVSFILVIKFYQIKY
jgi:VanZ family protein